MTGYLFDTSSLLYIVKYRGFQKLKQKDCVILDLTFYEYGNAILNFSARRSEGQLLSEEETQILLQAYEKVTEMLTVRNLEDSLMTEIFKIAKKEKITFYDASYLYYSKHFGYQLITEDKKLAQSAANNSIAVTDADKWIKTR